MTTSLEEGVLGSGVCGFFDLDVMEYHEDLACKEKSPQAHPEIWNFFLEDGRVVFWCEGAGFGWVQGVEGGFVAIEKSSDCLHVLEVVRSLQDRKNATLCHKKELTSSEYALLKAHTLAWQPPERTRFLEDFLTAMTQTYRGKILQAINGAFV